jgi:hypothetical protein
MAHERELSPAQRTAWVEMQSATTGAERAEATYAAARADLNRMLAQYEDCFSDPGPIDPAW